MIVSQTEVLAELGLHYLMNKKQSAMIASLQAKGERDAVKIKDLESKLAVEPVETPEIAEEAVVPGKTAGE